MLKKKHSHPLSILLAVSLLIVGVFPHLSSADSPSRLFNPPPKGDYPKGPLGTLAEQGERIFTETGKVVPQYDGNSLTCASCHLEQGRKAYAAPMWAAYVVYPRYDTRTHRLVQLDDQIRKCFRNSLNGTPPPLGGKTLKALDAYIFWLAKGAPIGAEMNGRGFKALERPVRNAALFHGPHYLKPPDRLKGMEIYATRCASCHGADGQGRENARLVPPVWGPASYTTNSELHSVFRLAEFLRVNMPPRGTEMLTDQESWDVAAYIDSQPRPKGLSARNNR